MPSIKRSRLRGQDALLESALNNLSQGLSMFDAAERLLLVNHQFMEMYGLSANVVKPGCSLIELLGHLARTWDFKQGPKELRLAIIAASDRRRTATVIMETADLRQIFLTTRRMTSGGWLVTHEDITERRRSEAKITYLAHHDALTDLPNRAAFERRLWDAFARTDRGEILALLCLDLDRFKSVNDTL